MAWVLGGYAVLMAVVEVRRIAVYRRVSFTPGAWTFVFVNAAAAGYALDWLAIKKPPAATGYAIAAIAVLTAFVAWIDLKGGGIALDYLWTHLISGHLGRVATREDVARTRLDAVTEHAAAPPSPFAGYRWQDQSLVSLAYGVMIRTRHEPKSTTRVASASTSMTRPRPYLSWVTWSSTANCSTGGAAAGGPNGLVGK